MADYDDRYRGDYNRRQDEDRNRRGNSYADEFRREFSGEGYGRDRDHYGSRDVNREQGIGHFGGGADYRGRQGRDYGNTDYAQGMRDDMRGYVGNNQSGHGSTYGGSYGSNQGGSSSGGNEDRGSRNRGMFTAGYDRDHEERAYYGNREPIGPGFSRDYGSPAGGVRYDNSGDYGRNSMTQTFGERGRSTAPGGYGQSSYRTASGGTYNRGGMQGGSDDRGFLSRAGDEIASWFGSDDAENRRERDARQGDSAAQHHVGRGPKNYQRSDSRIQEDINDRLTADPHLDASEIDVAVSGGDVTLTGTVPSRACKRRAEDVADNIMGVKHVQNNLRVQDRMGSGTSSYGTAGLGGASTHGSGGSYGGMAGTMGTTGTLSGAGTAMNAGSGSGITAGSGGLNAGGGTGFGGAGVNSSDTVRTGDTSSGSTAASKGYSTDINPTGSTSGGTTSTSGSSSSRTDRT